MKIYLAGPMTGIPQFNFPAFDAAAADLRSRGYTVVSPAELDAAETREAALASPDGAPGSGTNSGETWGDFLARDVKLIADEGVEAIVCLDGWKESRGARLETFVGRLCGLPVLGYVEGDHLAGVADFDIEDSHGFRYGREANGEYYYSNVIDAEVNHPAPTLVDPEDKVFFAFDAAEFEECRFTDPIEFRVGDRVHHQIIDKYGTVSSTDVGEYEVRVAWDGWHECGAAASNLTLVERPTAQEWLTAQVTKGVVSAEEIRADAIKQSWLDGEVRVTDPETGGQKGQKLAQLGALDPLALLEVGKVAGFGAQKYDRFNFAKGYAWSLSYDALQRHLLSWSAGDEADDESGLSHLGHAAWHCLALLTFVLRERGTDDRLHRMLEEA